MRDIFALFPPRVADGALGQAAKRQKGGQKLYPLIITRIYQLATLVTSRAATEDYTKCDPTGCPQRLRHRQPMIQSVAQTKLGPPSRGLIRLSGHIAHADDV